MVPKKLSQTCVTLLVLLLASCSPAIDRGAAPQAAVTAKPPDATAASPSGGVPATAPKPASEEPRYGGILPIALYFEPPGLDLHQQQLAATRMAAVPAYDTLLEYNPLKQDEIIPDLAERFELSQDSLVYTFYLRQGVKFHDGSLMTSEDVKYNLDRLRNPPRGILSPKKGLLASIDRIETPDAYTVKIFANYVDASFMGGVALSHHVIYPKKVVEEKGDMRKTVVGTGPFKFVRYETGVIVEYTKNRDYFRKGRPYLDGLMFYSIRDAATAFAAFRTGRVLLTSPGSGGLNASQVETTERELKGKARPLPYVSIQNTFVDINVSRKPLDDVRVRRALHFLADRPAIIKSVWSRQGAVSAFFVPEPYGKWELPNAELFRIPGYRPDKTADIEEAKKLLGEAGYAGGLSLNMAVRNVAQHMRAGEVLKEQYKAAGIDLKLDILETAPWESYKAKETYELLMDPWGVHVDDPTAWLENILRPDISFRDGQIDEWRRQQAKTLDFEERKKLVRQIELRLLELLPVVPSLKSGLDTMGIWNNVRNFPEPIGIWNSWKFTEVWLAK
ncbi:MAG: ABC transporter substrate-binding protein [Chloroflexi bacterium]|nr:ABC transporter substrate-binding protein [Chloroflexota bacterium]